MRKKDGFTKTSIIVKTETWDGFKIRCISKGWTIQDRIQSLLDGEMGRR